MILEALLSPLFFLIKSLINFIPENYNLPEWIASTVAILKIPLSIFPSDVWFVIIGNITFWLGVQVSWSVIEWAYKKIPGVD